MITCSQARAQLESIKALEQDFHDGLDQYKKDRGLDTILNLQSKVATAIEALANEFPWSEKRAQEIYEELVKWAQDSFVFPRAGSERYIDANFNIYGHIKRIRKPHSLVLSKYPTLHTLPDNLQIFGSLELDNCPEFDRMPSNLYANYVLIHNCPKLTKLPDDMMVSKNIRVDKALIPEAQRLKKLGRIGGEVLQYDQ